MKCKCLFSIAMVAKTKDSAKKTTAKPKTRSKGGVMNTLRESSTHSKTLTTRKRSTKSKVSKPKDPYEKESSRVAEKVARKKTKSKPKPKGEVIPKLEIEKPHPRKLPVPMPPLLAKKSKTKKTTKKTTTKKKK